MIDSLLNQLTAEIKELNRKYTEIRRDQIIVLVWIVALFVCSICCLNYLINDVFVRIEGFSRFTLLLLLILIYIAFLTEYRYTVLPKLNSYLRLDKQAQITSNKIVDEADWSSFRKRDPDCSKRVRIFAALESLSKLRSKKFVPYALKLHRVIMFINLSLFLCLATIWILSIFPQLSLTLRNFLIAPFGL